MQITRESIQCFIVSPKFYLQKITIVFSTNHYIPPLICPHFEAHCTLSLTKHRLKIKLLKPFSRNHVMLKLSIALALLH